MIISYPVVTSLCSYRNHDSLGYKYASPTPPKEEAWFSIIQVILFHLQVLPTVILKLSVFCSDLEDNHQGLVPFLWSPIGNIPIPPLLPPHYSAIDLPWKAYFKTINHLVLKALNQYFINNLQFFMRCCRIKHNMLAFFFSSWLDHHKPFETDTHSQSLM